MKHLLHKIGMVFAIPVVLLYSIMAIQHIKAQGSKIGDIAVLDVATYLRSHYVSKIGYSACGFWACALTVYYLCI